ncbi:hypothetical protein DLREEDagrD3_16990 [Denitratisoma sp. agr-D3]
MISQGKCPKCEKIISSVTIEDVDVVVGMQSKWRGISYLCPYCKTVLSVGIDPIALKTETVNGLLKALGH